MMFPALFLMVAAVGANLCSQEATCESCLNNNKCAFVQGRLVGEEKTSYRCIDSKLTRQGITVSMRIRSPSDCGMADDDRDLTETTGLRSPEQTAVEMLVSTTDMECPSVTPLMIAFFVLSILLAVVVSIITTIACWLSCCGGNDSYPTSQDQEMGKMRN